MARKRGTSRDSTVPHWIELVSGGLLVWGIDDRSSHGETAYVWYFHGEAGLGLRGVACPRMDEDGLRIVGPKRPTVS